MKLSEQLKQDHDCGDFGQALEGYAERAKKLEDLVWKDFYNDACNWGATDTEAREFANEQMDSL